MKEYAHLLKTVYQLSLRKTSKYCPNKIKTILDKRDLPFQVIHIAGTNGKGSVAHKIAKALTVSGYKTALFTSPHISSFRERIQIDQTLISEKDVVRILGEILKKYSFLSFFEMLLLLSIEYFQEQKVDFAVIETGIGGRLDATNVLKSILSIITSIGIDHENLLGTTLDQISFEKAGIIKKGVPVILGDSSARAPVMQKAKSLGAPVFIAPQSKGTFYDYENILIAKLALDYLAMKVKISQKESQIALKERPKCRFEILQKKGLILLDVAHNASAFQSLLRSFLSYFPQKKPRFYLSFSKDKNIESCLDVLMDYPIHLSTTDHPRLCSFSFLSSIQRDFILESDLIEGFNRVQNLAFQNNEVVVVAGSFYIMQKIRENLGIDEARDSTLLTECYHLIPKQLQNSR